MKQFLVYLLIHMYSGCTLAERRRVSFMNCPSAKTNSDIVTTTLARSRLECSVICLNDPACLSASSCKVTGGYTCQLSRVYTQGGGCSGLDTTVGCSLTAIINPCENGAVFYPQNRTCQCAEGFVGAYCQRRYRDCKETPGGNVDYLMQPLGSEYVFEWTCYAEVSRYMRVLEVRFPNPSNFNVTWNQMKKGTPTHVPDFYFIGLENLHQLTKQGMYNMFVLLWYRDVDYGSVWYKNVRVDSEKKGYTLHWDYSEITRNREYLDGLAGAGDDSKNLNGARFSTFDNDINGCARAMNASWWFNPAGCSRLGFESKGIFWPTNRSGAVGMDLMDLAVMGLSNVYWYVEDDLVL